MRAVVLVVVFVLVMAPFTAFSDEIFGTYKCKGTNAGKGNYKGKVIISKKGEVYELKWKIDKQEFNGVGILDGNVLSVGYTDSNNNWFGAMHYKVDGDKLYGKWIVYGSSKIGTETLTRK